MSIKKRSSHYHGSKQDWERAWRNARSRFKRGLEPDPRFSGLGWKAQLIVSYERAGIDPLTIELQTRFNAYKIIQDITRG